MKDLSSQFRDVVTAPEGTCKSFPLDDSTTARAEEEPRCLSIRAWEIGGGARITTTLLAVVGVVVKFLSHGAGALATAEGLLMEGPVHGLLVIAFFEGPS